jgi:hypothetical protein
MGREARDIEGRQRLAAHGINVGEGIGRGNGAEKVRIVHNRGEKVHGQDQGGPVVEAKDSRVVGGVNADDESLVSGEVYSPEQFLEVARPQFGRSTRGFGPAGQADLVFFFLAHLRPLCI